MNKKEARDELTDLTNDFFSGKKFGNPEWCRYYFCRKEYYKDIESLKRYEKAKQILGKGEEEIMGPGLSRVVKKARDFTTGHSNK